MINLLVLAGVAVAAFVFGVLFERRNSKAVEADISWIKAEVAKLSGHGSKPVAPTPVKPATPAPAPAAPVTGSK